jgi:hypothetical protein
MINVKYSRRLLLQGLGLSASMLPLLDAEQSDAQAAAVPKRLITIAWGHGVCEEYFFPKTDQIVIDADNAQSLEPLAPFRSKMLQVCGLDNQAYLDAGRQYDGHSGYPGLFTGTHDGAGKSVDQAVADGLRAQGVNKAALHLVVGVEPDGNSISYKGDKQKNTPETDPFKLFTRLFSGATLPPDQLAKIVAHKKSMLDYVGKDLQAFATRLGRDDRSKIDAHLQGIRDLETELAAGGGGKACAAPDIGTSRSLDTPTRSKLMFTLIGAALRCDLTRVVSMTFYDDHGKYNVRFPWLNIADDYHPLAHAKRAGYATKSKIDAWLFSQVALLAKDLEETIELGKTALDNSVIVASSEMNSGWSHYVGGLPFLLIGSCGGYFKTDGRAIKLGKWAGKSSGFTSAGGVPHNRLLASLSNAMGVPVQSFGEAKYTGTLDTELHA